jgi:hypothetical protein
MDLLNTFFIANAAICAFVFIANAVIAQRTDAKGWSLSTQR